MFSKKVDGWELDIHLTNHCMRKKVNKTDFIREKIGIDVSTHYLTRDRDEFLNEKTYKKYKKALPDFEWDE